MSIIERNLRKKEIPDKPKRVYQVLSELADTFFTLLGVDEAE